MKYGIHSDKAINRKLKIYSKVYNILIKAFPKSQVAKIMAGYIGVADDLIKELESSSAIASPLLLDRIPTEEGFFPILMDTITEDVFNAQDLYFMTPDGDLRLCIAWGECLDKMETYMYWYIKTSINKWLREQYSDRLGTNEYIETWDIYLTEMGIGLKERNLILKRLGSATSSGEWKKCRKELPDGKAHQYAIITDSRVMRNCSYNPTAKTFSMGGTRNLTIFERHEVVAWIPEFDLYPDWFDEEQGWGYRNEPPITEE